MTYRQIRAAYPQLANENISAALAYAADTVGYGDYTAERDELFEGMTLDDMIAEIKQRRVQTAPETA